MNTKQLKMIKGLIDLLMTRHMTGLHTATHADIITETYFNWSGETWNVYTWSDPSGAGCSAVAYD